MISRTTLLRPSVTRTLLDEEIVIPIGSRNIVFVPTPSGKKKSSRDDPMYANVAGFVEPAKDETNPAGEITRIRWLPPKLFETKFSVFQFD